MINVANLTKGQKIVVRSTDPVRDGFTSETGSFLNVLANDNGAYAFEYETRGMVSTQFVSKVVVRLA